MRGYRKYLGRGVFTLMELGVIVVVVGAVAGIVGPRMSRAGSSSPCVGEQLLVGDLRGFREAIRAYAEEHGGHVPDGDAASVCRQLTQFSDWVGMTSPKQTARYRLGPYLREIPAIRVGAKCGSAGVRLADQPEGAGGAWVYDARTGQVRPDTGANEVDSRGVPYWSY